MDLRALATMARDQQGVFSRWQAYARGADERWLRRAEGRGLLDRHALNVFGFAGLPPSWRLDLMVGMLDLGDGTTVSYCSAGAFHVFDSFLEGPLEYTIPAGRWIRRAGLSIHTADDLRRVDRVLIGGFVVTTPARTIIDLSSVVDSERLGDAVDSALRDRLTTEAVLRRRLAALRRQGRRGVRLLDEVLDGRPMGGPMASRLERRFLALVRSAHLPEPECQVVFRDSRETHIARVDFFFRALALVVEVSGHRTHSSRSQRANDAIRHRRLVARGIRPIEFTSDEVFGNPSGVLADLLPYFVQAS
jgi:very-short-patch-repair endonuclease